MLEPPTSPPVKLQFDVITVALRVQSLVPQQDGGVSSANNIRRQHTCSNRWPTRLAELALAMLRKLPRQGEDHIRTHHNPSLNNVEITHRDGIGQSPVPICRNKRRRLGRPRKDPSPRDHGRSRGS